jgi:hypothetical protein
MVVGQQKIVCDRSSSLIDKSFVRSFAQAMHGPFVPASVCSCDRCDVEETMSARVECLHEEFEFTVSSVG